MKLFKKAKKGFTLVELVVVIAVIAILAGVSVGAYFGITTSANNSKCEQEAKAIHTALLTVVSDPAKGYSFGKDGFTYTLDSNKVEQNETKLLGHLTAMTGITYNPKVVTPAEQLYPCLDFEDLNAEANPAVTKVSYFTYSISADVTRKVLISTGAFIA